MDPSLTALTVAPATNFSIGWPYMDLIAISQKVKHIRISCIFYEPVSQPFVAIHLYMRLLKEYLKILKINYQILLKPPNDCKVYI